MNILFTTMLDAKDDYLKIVWKNQYILNFYRNLNLVLSILGLGLNNLNFIENNLNFKKSGRNTVIKRYLFLKRKGFN